MATSKDTGAYALERLEPLDVRAIRTRHLAAAQKPSAMCGQGARGASAEALGASARAPGGIRRGAAPERSG